MQRLVLWISRVGTTRWRRRARFTMQRQMEQISVRILPRLRQQYRARRVRFSPLPRICASNNMNSRWGVRDGTASPKAHATYHDLTVGSGHSLAFAKVRIG